MKAAIDTIGYFWLSCVTERMPGRLLFDAQRRRLDVFGSLEGTQAINGALGAISEEKMVVLGLTTTKSMVLLDCQRVVTLPNHLHSSAYRVGSVIDGLSKEEGHSLEFDSVDIQLSQLGDWVGSIDTYYTREESTGEISTTNPPYFREEYPFKWGKVALTITYVHHMYGNQVITPRHSLEIAFDKPHNIHDIRKLRSGVQHLLTIGCGNPSIIERCEVASMGKTAALHEYTQGDELGSAQYLHPVQYIFEYTDIGGVCGIAKWLDLYLEYERPINSLVSHHYIDLMYAENRYINFMMAIEGMAAQKSAMKMKSGKRVEYITKMLNNGFKNRLFKDEKSALKWAKDAVEIRNKWAAHGGENGDVDYNRMDVFAESIYYVALVWLFIECNMPQSVITRIQECWGFGNTKSQIANYFKQ